MKGSNASAGFHEPRTSTEGSYRISLKQLGSGAGWRSHTQRLSCFGGLRVCIPLRIPDYHRDITMLTGTAVRALSIQELLKALREKLDDECSRVQGISRSYKPSEKSVENEVHTSRLSWGCICEVARPDDLNWLYRSRVLKLERAISSGFYPASGTSYDR